MSAMTRRTHLALIIPALIVAAVALTASWTAGQGNLLGLLATVVVGGPLMWAAISGAMEYARRPSHDDRPDGAH